ncbi:MAG TPA: DUF6351 family protein [Vicinamibacterales bacterium]|nr:DUF6351 family protein [Vicinamibacterales bacterium]
MRKRDAGWLISGLALTMVSIQPVHSRAKLEIRTLSSRADLVSGGDTLLAVTVPPGTRADQLSVTVNGHDVTAKLSRNGESDEFRGLVGGLVAGTNKVVAKTRTPKADATLTIVNHPSTGPILSGPHISPFECSTEASGLGPALDANCSAPRQIWRFYRSTDNSFKPLTDPAPADVATTTTTDGRTVPYVVRVDSGVINRAIYQFAVLDDLAGWNKKVVVSFGGSSGTQYIQGVMAPPPGGGVLNHQTLSKGFGYLISSELINGRRGNGVLQGETLMMIKEYLTEQYGVPKWYAGSGGSGGAIQQLVITQMYPGLLDGLMPSLTFPDSSLHTMDSILLTNLWPKLDKAVWTPEKITAVEGFTPGTARAWNQAYGRLGVPTNAAGCALVDKTLVFDPVTNPKGARCTTQDIRVNIYGRDPKTGWARRPTDNIGIQYGLAAVNSGAITVDEFLEVNETVGGTDINGAVVPQRTEGDPVAIKAMYESGLKASYNSALGHVPILMSRVYTDNRGDIHDRQRDFVVRARLQRANGRTDNTVIWIAATAQPIAGALDTMTKWLDAMAADPAPLTPDKIVKHKPAEAVDTCWDASGTKIVEPASVDAPNKCNAIFPVHSEPRLVAGAPLTNDIMKCQLKPVSAADYKVAFTDAQTSRLKAIFPAGVCDWSKPGVNQVPIKGTYQRY